MSSQGPEVKAKASGLLKEAQAEVPPHPWGGTVYHRQTAKMSSYC